MAAVVAARARGLRARAKTVFGPRRAVPVAFAGPPTGSGYQPEVGGGGGGGGGGAGGGGGGTVIQTPGLGPVERPDVSASLEYTLQKMSKFLGWPTGFIFGFGLGLIGFALMLSWRAARGAYISNRHWAQPERSR
jgi:hypothetical protein